MVHSFPATIGCGIFFYRIGSNIVLKLAVAICKIPI